MPAKKITPEIRVQRKLKAAKAEMELTDEKIAKKMGMKSGTAVNAWINHKHEMTVKQFLRLCKILNLNATEIIEIYNERT